MNRNQAHALVRQVFTQAFDKRLFLEFCRNLLNRIDEQKAQSWNNSYVKDAFKAHVQRYERIGTFTSPAKEKLDVLIVYLTHESKLERTRTALRNFVADHLKTRDEKDAALVAFVSPSENTWRFSFVKMEYATIEKDSGKVGVETRLTPARRFSYIVGAGESCHTAQTRFLDLLQDTEADPKLANIEDAFSVEAVTKEFFKKYVELFGKIHEALEKLTATDKILRDEFTARGVNTVEFAKKLMGQIVFLYFLQKKGWLGVARGHDWGSGPRDFLRRMADGEHGQYDNFFNDALEPLFYDTLSTDRGHEAWCDHFKCRIPFLNGGLFEPPGNYDWRNVDIALPNHLFTNDEFVEEGITGSGVLDVFDRFNFTVNEAEPLEKEVAIDPEMLGKVFENLIEDNRRKGLGAFYTPREIVHYMCQESLINYLDTSVNTRQKSLIPTEPKQVKLFGEPDPEQPVLQIAVYEEVVPRADIETFVHLGEQISHYEAVETEYRIKMPQSIEQHARLIDEKLADITVCDPAVGSGAFPVGMMTEIVRARGALTSYFNDVHERTPYAFKRHAIQNCLYGVDTDPGAVEIAKLRLWLSLVVDEEDVKQIKPLPNLDYKVVTGNSLVGFPFKSQRLHQIETLKQQLFDETDHQAKTRLKTQIDKTLEECFAASKRSLGYEVNFDFEIFFSEVFHKKDGFDVVIGNPPYNAELTNSERADYKKRYKSVSSGRQDTAAIFVEVATKIAPSRSTVSYILPYRLFSRKRNHGQFQLWLLKNHDIREVVYIGPHPGFTANDEFMLLRLSVGRQTEDSIDVAFKPQIASDRSTIPFTHVKQSLFLELGEINLSILKYDPSLMSKITSGAIPLESVCKVRDGIVPYIREKLISDRKLDNRYVKFAGIAGKYELRRYYFSCDELYLCYDINEAKKHIKDPIELRKVQLRDINIFLSRKIITAQNSATLKGTIDEDKLFVSNSIHSTYLRPEWKKDISLEYILGLINSTLMNYFHDSMRVKATDLHPQILVANLKKLPIKLTDTDTQNIIVSLVRKILATKKLDRKADTTALEREIDHLVYQLYDLTPEEIALVEESARAK